MIGLRIISAVMVCGFFFSLGAMAEEAVKQTVEAMVRQKAKVTSIVEASSESLSNELQSVLEKYIKLERDRHEAEKMVKQLPVAAEASFEQYTLRSEHIAGGISRDIKNIIELLKNPEHFKQLGLIELPIGMVLHGPSGTGKTLLAKLIASQTGRLMAHEYSSSFITNFQGSGVDRIKKLFDEARRLDKPVIIFIDEIDGLANNELKGSEGEATRAVHELHRQLGTLGRKLFVIMATNNYDKIPPSLKDRFANTTYCVGLPDFATRHALLKQLCVSARVQLSEQFFAKLATETEGLSCRVLENLVTNALISAGQRLPDCALASGDFYIAAYTTQAMRLPNTSRRIKLIKHYFEGKAVATDVDDDCCTLCLHETEGWDAQKIEKWSLLAEGLARAKGCAQIGKDHLLIAFSLIDKNKVTHKVRRKLLFTHFFAHRSVKKLAAFMDVLLEETDNVSTEGLQTMVELAVDIMKQARKTELTKKHLFTACALLFKRPLTHYMRLLVLTHYLTQMQCGGLSKEFLHPFALQMRQTTCDDVKNIVGKAVEISRMRSVLVPEPDDFYVALCLNQKNEPVRLKEYIAALVRYYLKLTAGTTLTQKQCDELIDSVRNQTPAT